MRGLLATWGSPAFCSNQNLFRMQKEDNDFFFPVIYLWLCCVFVFVAMHRFSCPEACEIFLDQESNPCPLHWQADS